MKRPKRNGVFFIDRPLPDIQDAMPELAPDDARSVADGLVWADMPYDELNGSLLAGEGLGDGWHGAIAPDLLMSVPVTGQPRMWHGFAGAEPAPRTLPKRTDSTSGGGVLVGIIDTGIRHHPWLSGGYLAAPDDFEPIDVDGDDQLEAQAGHGTFVAGVVLQQAPAASLWIEKALDTDGDGFTAEVSQAAIRLAKRGVNILNLSLGCFADQPAFREVVAHVVAAVHRIRPGVVVVAAAGNLASGQQPQQFWPAALPNVIGVGALRKGNGYQWAEFSNRGDWVDFAAPGEGLVSTYLRHRPRKDNGLTFNGWAEWSGTSFATAVVSGTLARIMTEYDEPAAAAVERLKHDAKAHTADELQVPVIDGYQWA